MAALTTEEAIQIQFGLFREAAGLPKPDAPPPSEAHSKRYTTFETGLPLTLPFSSVQVKPEHQVVPTKTGTARFTAGPQWHCPFCARYGKPFRNLGGVLAHLKNNHKELPEENKLEHVVRIAKEYSALAATRKSDYVKTNQRMMKRAERALDPAFTWAEFSAWDFRDENVARNKHSEMDTT